MKPMTEKEYLQEYGSRCPSCGSENITNDICPPSTGPSYLYLRIECKDCGASWRERYVLMGMRDLDTGEAE